jgi:kynurenine formamidase
MSRALLCLLALAALVPVGWQKAGGADTPPAKKKLTKADFEAMMTSLSNWGRWGKEDQLGALNLITPQKRRQAAALVRDGVTFSLAHDVLKEEADGSPAFVHKMVMLPEEGKESTAAADEYAVRYHGFTHTHLDALCHLAYRGKLYNGFSQKEVTAQGSRKLSVLQVKDGIFTRCIFFDFPCLFGDRYLQGGKPIYPEDLEAWEKKAGVKVEAGDCVLIRTGRWARRAVEGAIDMKKGAAGLHASCMPWLKQRDIALLGSDLATDVMPSRVEGVELPVHWLAVVAMGTPILDNCDLERLSETAAERKRWAFLLVVAPLAVEGGTGSPVNPLAVY